MRAVLLLFLVLLSYEVKAQTNINGLLKGKEDGKVLAGVSVSVKEKNATGILSYAITDAKGLYHLSFKSLTDSVVITVSGFNLKKIVQTVENKNRTLDFTINAEAIKLKEIKVNPPKIRALNDTLNYLVDGFIDQNDRTIGDALRKMPGITVNDDGSILYNNKPINKFYIENKDLLQGSYGIATNNVEAKDVETVQVLENHQPIKALKNREFTDEAAINLKLKDSAKGILVANGQIGTGLSPVLWNNELVSTYFDKNRQSVITYKGNNTGNDAATELKSLYDTKGARQSPSLSVQSPSAPGINQGRYLFNRANAASVNNLWAFGKERQLNANISYLNDRQTRESYSRSAYYLPGDSLLAIEENLKGIEHLNVLDGNLKLNINRDKYYLDNTLKFTGKWNTELGNVLNDKEITQNFINRLFKLSNEFSMIRNVGKASFNLSSNTLYSNTPQTLDIRPMLYEDLFEGFGDWNLMRQKLYQSQFSSSNRFALGLNTGKLKQNYRVGVNVDLRHLNTELRAGLPDGDLSERVDSLNNRLNWNKFELTVESGYIYKTERLTATANFPVTYNMLDIKDLVFGTHKYRNNLFFNPSLNLVYELNLFWNINARASFNSMLGGVENSLKGYILQSYRSLVRNEGQLPEEKKQSYSVSWSYLHPIHALFLNFGTSYTQQKRNLLYGYDYEGIRNLKRAYELPNNADGFSAFFQMSKGIDAIATKVTFQTDYNFNNAAQISQGKVIDFKGTQYGLSSGFSSTLSKRAGLFYNINYRRNGNKITNNEADFKPIITRTQSGGLNLFVTSAFTLNMGIENYYNSRITDGNRIMNFADVGAKYKYKGWLFNLEYNNIFNARQYVSASYNEISSYYSVYNLRPAQLLMKVRFKIK